MTGTSGSTTLKLGGDMFSTSGGSSDYFLFKMLASSTPILP